MMLVQSAAPEFEYFTTGCFCCGVPPCNSPTAITFPCRSTMTREPDSRPRIVQSREPPSAYLIVRNVLAPELESNDQPVTNMLPAASTAMSLATSMLVGEDLK